MPLPSVHCRGFFLFPPLAAGGRLIRIIAGLGILGAGLYFKSWWGLIGLVPLLPAVFRFCPADLPFGLNTGGIKKD